MPATTLDSAIFRDIFSTAAMRRIFSDEYRVQCYLDFEAALARVQARLGIIPERAAAEIVRHCKVENIDLVKLKAQTERIGYPILGVVQQLVALSADGSGEYCHWGATTQDVTDTAAVLQMRAALELVEQDLAAISAALAGLAKRHRLTPDGRAQQPAAGRPHHLRLQDRDAAWRQSQRHRARLAELRPRVLVGEFGGAAGTLASLGVDGLKVQAALMTELGLGQPDDRLAHRARRFRRGCLLPGPGDGHARQARDRREAPDADGGRARSSSRSSEGRGSSSTMPQKRNPISLPLHPRDGRAGAPARRRHCSRRWSPTTSARPAPGRSNGSRFRNLPPRLGRAGAEPLILAAASRSTPRACGPISTSPRPRRLGGGDDGAWRRISAASAPTTSSTTSAARW